MTEKGRFQEADRLLNIVAIHDVGESSRRPYLVMELVPGESLAARPPESLEESAIVGCELRATATGPATPLNRIVRRT